MNHVVNHFTNWIVKTDLKLAFGMFCQKCHTAWFYSRMRSYKKP